jgi:hypothetical protein
VFVDGPFALSIGPKRSSVYNHLPWLRFPNWVRGSELVEIPVLLEPLPDGGFRARSGDPLELEASGDTPDTALRNLRALIETRFATGSVLTTIQVSSNRTGRHPGAGIYQDEPLFDRWQSAIEAYRREIEDDPEAI